MSLLPVLAELFENVVLGRFGQIVQAQNHVSTYNLVSDLNILLYTKYTELSIK